MLIPHNRPDLFTTLLSTMEQAFSAMQVQGNQTQARLVLHRCLLYFQQAVKKLSENRMARGKQIIGKVRSNVSQSRLSGLTEKLVAQLAEQSLGPLIHLYRSFFTSCVNALPSLVDESSNQPDDLELSLLAFKVLTKLVVYGWGGSPSTPEEKEAFLAQEEAFFNETIPDFSSFLSLRKQKILIKPDAGSKAKMDLLNKHIKAFGKFYKALLMQNHRTFHALGATRQLTQICWNEIQEASGNVMQIVSGKVLARTLANIAQASIVGIQTTPSHFIGNPSSSRACCLSNLASLSILPPIPR